MNTTGNHTILIIDDQRENLFIMEEIVREHLPNITPMTALGARQGLKMVRPDTNLIISDVQMPGMTGIELCRTVKSDLELKHIPILLITAHQASTPLRVEGLEAGAMDFIPRPIDSDELVAKIQVALDVRTQSDALRTEKDALGERVKKTDRKLVAAEIRYKTLFDNATDAILILALTGEVLEANVETHAMLGYKRSSMQGMLVSDITPGDDSPLLLESVPASGVAISVTNFMRGDGSTVPVEVRCRIIDLGTEQAIMAVARDISERLVAQQHLQQSEDRFQTLVQTSVDGFWVVDAEGVLLEVNDAYHEMVGYAPNELIGTRLWERDANEDQQMVMANIRRIIETGSARFETEHLRKDGTSLPVEVSTTYEPSHDHFLAFISDTSERKQAEEERKALQHRLQALWNLAQMTGATHEELCDHVVEEIRILTGSEHSFFGFPTDGGESLLIHAWSKEVMRQCEVDKDQLKFHLNKDGIWAKAIADKKPARFNSLPFGRGRHEKPPTGHIPLSNLLGVPILRRGKVVALAAVANKDGDYTEEDETQIASFVSNAMLLLDRSIAETALKESESRFRMLFENAPLAYQSLDQTGHILDVNKKWQELLGYSDKEVLGTWFGDLLVPEHKELFRKRFLKFKDVCMIDGAEFEMTRKDGSTFLVSFNGRIQTDKTDHFLRTHCIFSDITLQRENEKRIRKESTLNQTQALIAAELVRPGSTLESLANVVHENAMALSGSKFGFVSTIDPATEESTGHALSSMLSEKDCTLKQGNHIAFPKGSHGYDGMWGISLNTAQPFYTNDPANHPLTKGVPEGHVPLEQFLSAPAIYQGELLGQISLANPGRAYTDEDVKIISVLADLFAVGVYRIRMQEAIENSRDQAQKANRIKSEFLANMSHELRTPLNGVMGMLQLFGATPLDEDQTECLDIAMQSCRRLTRLLGDILDLSRVEAGMMSITIEPFCMADILRSLGQLFAPTAGQKALELTFELDPAIPETLLGDGYRLQQVLNNLVGNSLKFTEQGTVAVKAELLTSPQEEEHAVLFSVTDTGIGIAEDKIAMIFDPFTQAEDSFTRKYQGAGLGLAICKRLINLMNGEISVDSKENVGTTFRFSIPFQTLDRTGESDCEPTKNSKTNIQDLRVLLVEDETVNQIVMARMLDKLGCRTAIAPDGKSCLKILKKNSFDVVLMDVQMPIMDGLEATQAIRDGKVGDDKKDIHIIATTAYAMRNEQEKILNSGVNSYLSKPVEMLALREALQAIPGK